MNFSAPSTISKESLSSPVTVNMYDVLESWSITDIEPNEAPAIFSSTNKLASDIEVGTSLRSVTEIENVLLKTELRLSVAVMVTSYIFFSSKSAVTLSFNFSFPSADISKKLNHLQKGCK